MQTFFFLLSCLCNRWISNLHPETSRWLEGRDRRGRGPKKRLSRLLARRGKVNHGDKKTTTGRNPTAYALVCFNRAKETNACTRRGRPQGSEDDDQTEGELVCAGGLTDDALQGGLPSAQQQGAHTCPLVVM